MLVGAPLVAISAIGAADPKRRTKITTGLAASATVIANPTLAVNAAQQTFQATTSTLKQTAQLAQSGIGLLTMASGAIGSGVLLYAVSKKNKKRKRQ